MSELRVGILGCGKMGRIYARWFSRNACARVVSFYNRTFSRAEELAAQYPGTRAMKSWQEVTEDADVDVVGICTPSHEHLAQMRSAVLAGKHVLCEKPMALDVNECREMVRIASGAPVKVAVGFQMRFHPVIRKVEELLAGIGTLFHLDFVFGMYRPEVGWRHQLIQGGGVQKELSSHLFDLARHWTGEVSAVTAQNRIISPGKQVEDYSVNLIEFDSGVTGYLWSNYLDRRSRCIYGHLMGTDGQITWQFSPYDPADSRVTLFTNTAREDAPVSIPDEIDEVYPGHLDSFGREIDSFLDCIRSDGQPVVGVVEGMKAIEVINASYESTRLRRRIELPLRDFDVRNIEKCFVRFDEG